MRRPESSVSVKRRSRLEAAVLGSSSGANSYPREGEVCAGSFSILCFQPRHPEAGVADLGERGEVLWSLPDAVEAFHTLAFYYGVGELLAEFVLLQLDVEAGEAEDGRLEGRAVAPAPGHALFQVLVVRNQALAHVVHDEVGVTFDHGHRRLHAVEGIALGAAHQELYGTTSGLQVHREAAQGFAQAEPFGEG